MLNIRMYDGFSPRSCSRDPIGYRGDRNLFVYVANQPLRRVDPKGHLQQDPPLVLPPQPDSGPTPEDDRIKIGIGGRIGGLEGIGIQKILNLFPLPGACGGLYVTISVDGIGDPEFKSLSPGGCDGLDKNDVQAMFDKFPPSANFSFNRQCKYCACTDLKRSQFKLFPSVGPISIPVFDVGGGLPKPTECTATLSVRLEIDITATLGICAGADRPAPAFP